MKKALIIVDMQEEYIGQNSKYNFANKDKFIQNIKNRISNFSEYVIYFKNNHKTKSSNIIKELLISNAIVFDKNKIKLFFQREI